MCIMCMAYKNKYIVSSFRSDGCECLENDLTILSFSLEDIEPKLSIEFTTETYKSKHILTGR